MGTKAVNELDEKKQTIIMQLIISWMGISDWNACEFGMQPTKTTRIVPVAGLTPTLAEAIALKKK